MPHPGSSVYCAFTPSLPLQRHVPPLHKSPQTRMCDTSYRTSSRNPQQRARDFLTQRSVQQTMFCARVLRDETTTRWLEDWLDHRGLYDLHHCDALNVSSEQYLSSLLKQPPVTLQIKKPIPGRTTNKNPYIKRRYFCYDVEIDPRNLARRILQVRKQIAEELACDIPCIRSENHRTVELYRTSVLDPQSLSTSPLNMPSNGDNRGSPYRQANFDLVKNYTLYLGLIATVQELAENRRTEEDASWMRDFFEKHAESLLQPYRGRFGQAEQVLSQLLSATPSIRGGRLLFDPGLLADMVLTNRVGCSELWLEVMQKVSEEHLEFERMLLEEILESSAKALPQAGNAFTAAIMAFTAPSHVRLNHRSETVPSSCSTLRPRNLFRRSNSRVLTMCDMPPTKERLSLAGKTVVITGGHRGMGRDISIALAQAGADVVIIDKNGPGTSDVPSKVEKLGRRYYSVLADLAEVSDISRAVERTFAEVGYIDALVNNAGVALLDPFEELSVEKWDKCLAINLRAPFLLTQALANGPSGMLARGSGVIVNVTSAAGTAAHDLHAAYCASKAGLDMLTKVITSEWGKRGIRANAVAPTVVMTEMGKEVWGKPETGGPMLAKIPQGRFAEPFEVADAVVFLCSDASSMINGVVLYVDGGYNSV